MSESRELCQRLFAGDGDRFVQRACVHLPFSVAQLRAWADRLDWAVLGVNRGIPWTSELLREFEDRLDWEVLSRNHGAWWTPELIEAHLDRWSWKDLSRNPALPWTEDLLARHESRWSFAGVASLGRNPGLPWSPELVARYRDRWRFKDLSGNPGLPWTPALIDTYQDEWEWLALSKNPALPWSKELLATYPDRWRWGRFGLSENFGFPWSVEFLREHADRFDWSQGLSKNPALPWSEELVEEFRERWLWIRGGLSGNPGLPWSREMLQKYADELEFDGVYAVCDNTGVPWSPDILEDHAAAWDWKRLSFNETLPWGAELLERFEARWDRRTLQLNAGVFQALLPEAAEFEAVYDRIPDTPPAEDLAPRPVSKRVALARGRQLRKALGARRTHASVKPWLQDAVRLDGPLVLLPFRRAAKRVSSMDGLFGRLGSKPFPALGVGGDRYGTEFWLVPSTGAVISLHHDATFFELAAEVSATSVSGFLKGLVKRGSRLTWQQLLDLQAGAREREAAGEEPEEALARALLAATGWSPEELAGQLQHPAMEFARARLGELQQPEALAALAAAQD